MGNPEGKIPLWRPIGNWMDKDQRRVLLNTVMNLPVREVVGKFLSSHTTGGFSRRAQLHEGRYYSSACNTFCFVQCHLKLEYLLS
jgi:hypothetical protein